MVARCDVDKHEKMRITLRAAAKAIHSYVRISTITEFELQLREGLASDEMDLVPFRDEALTPFDGYGLQK